MNRNRFLGALVLASAVGAAGVASADEKPMAAPAGEKAKAVPAAMPSPEEIMKAWEAYKTPGEGHRRLDGFVGTWNVKMKSWMDPSKPPEESDGESVNQWILGNRYLEQRYTGTMMGKPFNGVGYVAFDNHKKKYQSTWMDDAGTGIMMLEGGCDKAGKVFTSWGSMDDFLTGRKNRIKERVTIVSPDTHKLEMWMTGPDGKMFKTLEGVYTRKK
jgi:hypothetical protein